MAKNSKEKLIKIQLIREKPIVIIINCKIKGVCKDQCELNNSQGK